MGENIDLIPGIFSEEKAVDFIKDQGLLTVGHYQFPICPDWEESYMNIMNRRQSLKNQDIIFLVRGHDSNQIFAITANIREIFMRVCSKGNISTGLIPSGPLCGSVLYAVNRDSNPVIAYGRMTEDAGVLNIKENDVWTDDEFRCCPNRHRSLVKNVLAKTGV